MLAAKSSRRRFVLGPSRLHPSLFPARPLLRAISVGLFTTFYAWHSKETSTWRSRSPGAPPTRRPCTRAGYTTSSWSGSSSRVALSPAPNVRLSQAPLQCPGRSLHSTITAPLKSKRKLSRIGLPLRDIHPTRITLFVTSLPSLISTAKCCVTRLDAVTSVVPHPLNEIPGRFVALESKKILRPRFGVLHCREDLVASWAGTLLGSCAGPRRRRSSTGCKAGRATS